MSLDPTITIKTRRVIKISNGKIIFEEPYLGSMVEKTSYDQIYDEHFYMFSIHSIKAIIKKFNLNLFHAEALKTHGGSMRYYICKNEKR